MSAKDTDRALEPTRQEILSGVEKLVEEVKVNPSNGELMQVFQGHAEEDQEVARKQAMVNEEQHDVNEVVKESLDKAHKKMDVIITGQEEIKDFMKNVNTGIGVFKFTWNNIGKIGGFALFILALFAFFKGGLLAFVAYLFNK